MTSENLNNSKSTPFCTEHPFIAAYRSLHSMPEVQFVSSNHPLLEKYDQVIRDGRARRERVLVEMRRKANI